jgi:hypothetical protein
MTTPDCTKCGQPASAHPPQPNQSQNTDLPILATRVMRARATSVCSLCDRLILQAAAAIGRAATQGAQAVSGEYLGLVLAAQADPDYGHRQMAMYEIADIAPHVSHDAMGGADAASAAVLARLYGTRAAPRAAGQPDGAGGRPDGRSAGPVPRPARRVITMRNADYELPETELARRRARRASMGRGEREYTDTWWHPEQRQVAAPAPLISDEDLLAYSSAEIDAILLLDRTGGWTP